MKLIFFLSILFCGVANAGFDCDEWRWYYVAFESFESSAGVFMRSGSAYVKKTNSKIEISFKDRETPELAPIFIGNMSKGKVRGTLRGFFMYDEDLKLFGHFQSTQVAKDCVFEEVTLRPKEATGSILVLSRVIGTCE